MRRTRDIAEVEAFFRDAPGLSESQVSSAVAAGR
jgi:hypothetical protein